MAGGFAEEVEAYGVEASLSHRTITVPGLAQMCPCSMIAAAQSTTGRKGAQSGEVPQLKTAVADLSQSVFSPKAKHPVTTTEAVARRVESGVRGSGLLHGKPNRAGGVSRASARKKCALGEADVRPDAENAPGTPQAPGASGYWLHRTMDPWCVQIMVAWQPAAYYLLKGAFLGE